MHRGWRLEGEESDMRGEESDMGGEKKIWGEGGDDETLPLPLEPTDAQAIGPLVPFHLIPSPSAEWIWDLVASYPLF